VEQRYQAVREVLNGGALMTDVARRRGVSRQTVHEWLVNYANHGLVGLMDRSSKPQSCPHHMSPEVEARIVELRTEHPGWARRLRHRLGLEGFAPVPGRTSIYRCLVRHGLITPQVRRRCARTARPSRSILRSQHRGERQPLLDVELAPGARRISGRWSVLVSVTTLAGGLWRSGYPRMTRT
jgi:transposase-like protein